MPVEIERKFLVKGTAWRRDASGRHHMHQFYLESNETMSVRVRITNAETATLTTKLPGNGMTRYEFEQEIPLHEASALRRMSGSNGNGIEKFRYSVNYAGHDWVVDCYEGSNAGLVVAEIELEREDEIFIPPPWLGEEVTGVSRYRNSSLAHHPFTGWTEQLQFKVSA